MNRHKQKHKQFLYSRHFDSEKLKDHSFEYFFHNFNYNIGSVYKKYKRDAELLQKNIFILILFIFH